MENIPTGKLNGRQIKICLRTDNIEEQKNMTDLLIVKEIEKSEAEERLIKYSASIDEF